MLLVWNKTGGAIHKFAARIQLGMREEGAMELTRRTLQEAGLLRGWHGIHVANSALSTAATATKRAPSNCTGRSCQAFRRSSQRLSGGASW